TVFGKVLDDSDQKVVDSIRQGDTITKVSIDGDTEAIFESVKDRVSEWNQTLDRNFPNLS
ncbi:MAG: peptidylprolyl isomerase, partial [Calditrichaeota bacterium]|nr:peptidylprolyl isomerase [Calditrichota bacterium]